jgi:hypothetical protein
VRAIVVFAGAQVAAGTVEMHVQRVGNLLLSENTASRKPSARSVAAMETRAQATSNAAPGRRRPASRGRLTGRDVICSD